MSVKNTQGTPPFFIPPSTTFGYISTAQALALDALNAQEKAFNNLQAGQKALRVATEAYADAVQAALLATAASFAAAALAAAAGKALLAAIAAAAGTTVIKALRAAKVAAIAAAVAARAKSIQLGTKVLEAKFTRDEAKENIVPLTAAHKKASEEATAASTAAEEAKKARDEAKEDYDEANEDYEACKAGCP